MKALQEERNINKPMHLPSSHQQVRNRYLAKLGMNVPRHHVSLAVRCTTFLHLNCPPFFFLAVFLFHWLVNAAYLSSIVIGATGVQVIWVWASTLCIEQVQA